MSNVSIPNLSNWTQKRYDIHTYFADLLRVFYGCLGLLVLPEMLKNSSLCHFAVTVCTCGLLIGATLYVTISFSVPDYYLKCFAV